MLFPGSYINLNDQSGKGTGQALVSMSSTPPAPTPPTQAKRSRTTPSDGPNLQVSSVQIAGPIAGQTLLLWLCPDSLPSNSGLLIQAYDATPSLLASTTVDPIFGQFVLGNALGPPNPFMGANSYQLTLMNGNTPLGDPVIFSPT